MSDMQLQIDHQESTIHHLQEQLEIKVRENDRRWENKIAVTQQSHSFELQKCKIDGDRQGEEHQYQHDMTMTNLKLNLKAMTQQLNEK
jgi:hypothetical protein